MALTLGHKTVMSLLNKASILSLGAGIICMVTLFIGVIVEAEKQKLYLNGFLGIMFFLISIYIQLLIGNMFRAAKEDSAG
jgi:hypothetical protein